MGHQETIDTLKDLIQLDFDASRAYDQAIEEIDVPSIRNQLIQYRSDHERHISNLSALLRRMGETPPEPSRDIKGFLIEGFTAIRSMTGTEGALKAMETNEKLTNKRYSQATSISMPTDVADQVERNFQDEQQHLQYIEQALTGRIWEPSESRMR